MKIRPLHDRILVRRIESEETTPGGLFIPETAKEKPTRGVVIAVGQGKIDEHGKRTPLAIKEGDHILFGKYAGSEIELEGQEHTILREDEIFAVIEE